MEFLMVGEEVTAGKLEKDISICREHGFSSEVYPADTEQAG